ncbi:MAG: hypothetical protein OXF83_09025 [Anaerolineaceae bacterium]|nr:hypothetical protein [Anaerolineaceae bacterium]
MSASFALSAISALFSCVCCFLVLQRWWHKRRPHLLAWGLGLLLYAIGTVSQVILALVWNPTAFALWYWCGAIMVAPVLGQGAVYLLWRRGSIARNLNMALLLVAAMTLPWTLFFTEFNADAWRAGHDMTTLFKDHHDEDGALVAGIMRGGMSGTVRFFSPVMNSWGTLTLVGGALYSAHLFRRKQILPNRVYGNVLIALGGLLPAFGGLMLRLGDPSFKYLGEMCGVALIFAGFLVASQEAPNPSPALRAAERPV